LKIPLYSQLKAKLESKGLDSITSGQLAWFVCSVGIFIIPTIYILFSNNNNQLAILFFMFIVFIFNLFYVVNIFPLLLVIAFNWIQLYFNYSSRGMIIYVLVAAFVVLVLICIVLKQWRFLITFCFSMAFIFVSMQLFYLLGGLVK
ncbi:hypothetical protein, partial [Helicobacter sp. MIT 14-3879]|uniref:hypothetical protein n=1 Tax=Helicobacter sp. MIT 14-3879 TaxID=2040649 RepID=UPI0015F16480